VMIAYRWPELNFYRFLMSLSGNDSFHSFIPIPKILSESYRSYHTLLNCLSQLEKMLKISRLTILCVTHSDSQHF
jgi:hypothetical protein